MRKGQRLEHLRQIAALGGKAKAAKERAAKLPIPPYGGSFLEFVDAVGRGGPSRAAWRTFWKVADGLPLEADEVETFRLHTGRSSPPTSPAREVWVIAGRRAGKSEQAVTRATWRAISKDWHAVLSAGELCIIPLVAADKEQAKNTLAYLKGLVHHPLVAPHVARSLKESVAFKSGVVVKVVTASWRTVRGFTLADALLEEVSFWAVEGSANPDQAIVDAVRPALLTLRRHGARVYGISSPYSRKGVLFDAWQKHWGKDESDVLVWNGSTAAMNPSVDIAEIARAFADDPAVAASEYGTDGLVTFRSDVEALLSREAVEAVVIGGRVELPRVGGVTYVAFVDPSGGSQDSMTLAIAHAERDGRVVLDCVREIKPPFSPESVVAEFARTVQSYGISKVVGDRYGGEWPREQFRKCGITYEPSERTKSDIYGELLPVINARRCELLDLPRLRAQLVGLERRVGRGTGRDSIDHGPGQRDDVANAVAGAVVLVAGGQAHGPRVIMSFGDAASRYESGKLDHGAEERPPEEYDEQGN